MSFQHSPGKMLSPRCLAFCERFPQVHNTEAPLSGVLCALWETRLAKKSRNTSCYSHTTRGGAGSMIRNPQRETKSAGRQSLRRLSDMAAVRRVHRGPALRAPEFLMPLLFASSPFRVVDASARSGRLQLPDRVEHSVVGHHREPAGKRHDGKARSFALARAYSIEDAPRL